MKSRQFKRLEAAAAKLADLKQELYFEWCDTQDEETGEEVDILDAALDQLDGLLMRQDA
jgi:hypothetical protein